MARGTTGKPGDNAWQWSRTAETRRLLLQAAREVFADKGFAEASVAEVVDRAESSVGSLYHHFGGKTELFLALWEEHQAIQEQNAARAVSKARGGGVEDRMALFIIGARAFLETAWQRRDLTLLFMDGDGPPGFEPLRRTRARDWVRQNAILLEASADVVGRVTVTALTAIIGEASREVAACATKRSANKVIEATIGLIRRLAPLGEADESA